MTRLQTQILLRASKMESDDKKRALYRAWYPIRKSRTVKDTRITYSQRFEQMYGQTLEDYHAELEKVAAMEFQGGVR